MDIKKILKAVDHTNLSVTATYPDIQILCEEGMRYQVASVCVPPCYVSYATGLTKGKLPVCTVIGFPNGYATTEVKCFEAEQAIQNGADEIDVVINIGYLRNKLFNQVEDELRQIRKVTNNKVLKVIVEACLLTEQEKEEICGLVTLSRANYIKTSTGFSTGGATIEDIALFSRCINSNVKIKASGGISTLKHAEYFLLAGATRLGSSQLVRRVLEME